MNLYRTAAIVTIFSALEHGLGFLYRIILSRTLGSEGLGVYQVALTVFAVFLTVSSSGLPITLSRVLSKHRAHRYKRGEHAATTAAILLTLSFSLPLTVLLFLLKKPFSSVFSDQRCADLFYIFLFGLSFTSVYAIIRGSFWGNKRFFAYSLIELIEELVMIVVGVLLLVVFRTGAADVNKAGIAVLVSYLCSFAIASVYFFARGGRLASPKGELLPLLKASLPVTAMRTSSSLMSSLVSVLFPMRLMAAGYSSARAMSEYGVIYGMVMPVLMIPSSLIGSIALVLVPELSESYYRGDGEKVSALVEKALNSTLLIACMLLPFFMACGEGVGVLLYSNATSGQLIEKSALMLLPMSLTMISTSLLNSLGCEKHTLLIFTLGSLAMLISVWVLPRFLGSGALVAGMCLDYLLCAVCSLLLLGKKTGRLRSGRYACRLALFFAPVCVLAVLLRMLLMRFLSYLPALALTLFSILILELVVMRLGKLFDLRAFIGGFLPKKKAGDTLPRANAVKS